MEYYCRKYAYKTDCGIVRFWMGPVPIVLLTRVPSIKAVLESPTLTTKPEEYKILARVTGDGLITDSGEKWRSRRKMISCFFHPTVLQSYETRFNSYSCVLTKKLDQFADKDEAFDLLPYLKHYTMDLSADIILGCQTNTQEGENLEYFEAVAHLVDEGLKGFHSPWLRIKAISRLLGHERRIEKSEAIARDFETKMVLARKKEYDSMKTRSVSEKTSSEEIDKKCFLDWYLSLQDEHNLSIEDIRGELGTLLFAGVKTKRVFQPSQIKPSMVEFLYDLTRRGPGKTVSAHNIISDVTGLFLFILGNKLECQNKIYEELISIQNNASSFQGEKERDVTSDDLRSLVYLDRCVKEALRYYPAILLFGRRITKDVRIGEYTIPAGVTAYISPFSVGRDPREWEEPDFYNPDNFSSENVAKRDPFAYVPFSAGIRNCLGMSSSVRKYFLKLYINEIFL
ncbi:unnamed protein product [Enterobius vermicularis]|uniref:Cytochrome n=1 Tax=Enterobius vermicularis TaxID=51028 RepID=A0A0N4UT67_ENTVE|nr:unnamed protein product [Enterobius vermicularis]